MSFRDILGWDVHETAIKVLKTFSEKLADDFLWIDEALAETKKTFNSSQCKGEDIRLIPKTPSAKRSRRQLRSSAAGVRRTLRSTAASRDSLDSGVDLLEVPRKTTRASTRKTSRAVGRKQQQDESRIDASLREEEVSDMETEHTSQSAVQDADRSLRKKNVVIVSSDDASCATEDTDEPKSSRASKRREAKEREQRELEEKQKAEEAERELKRKAEEKEVERRELEAKRKVDEQERESKRKVEEQERKERERAAEEEQKKEEKRKANEKEMDGKRELKRKAEEEKAVEEKRRAEENEKAKLDEDKENQAEQARKEADKLATVEKEKDEKRQREAKALNPSENASALVKECSVMLARDDSLTPIAVYSASKNQACVVSPPLVAANTSQLAASGGSGTSSAGRLFNFVKNAVGALLPSVMHKTSSPSSGKNTPANKTVTTMLMFDTPVLAVSPPSAASVVSDTNTITTNAAASDMRRVSSANRRSSIAKHRTSVGGPKLSMSKKRSLSRGNKARLSAAHRLSAPRSSVTAQTIKEVETVTLSSGSEAEITDDEDSEAEIEDTPPQRVTRSKVRQPPGQQPSKAAAVARVLPDAPPVRVTRSKMRVKPPQPKLDDSDDELATPTPATSGFHAPGTARTPSTVVRNKGSRVQQMQQMLCQNPSFGLRDPSTVSGKAGTATADAKVPVKRTSSKRANETADHNDSGSPPKRQCTAAEFMSPPENNRYHFPVNSQALRSTDAVHPMSFLNQLKKKQPTTPMHNSSSVGMLTSFIQRNTPKVLTREEIMEKKRRELEAKNKKTDETIAKRMEMNQQKLVEKQRLREERIQQVMRRKQEMEQQRDVTASFFTKKTTAGGSGSRINEQPAGSRMTTRQQPTDEPSKAEVLEKQKLRDKRMAEADQRRKQDEEAKRQLQLQQEREKQTQEEQARRRREQEENERRQRLEEQRRAEEERRARLERDRQLELERIRQAEEQRRKEEMERQKAREEQEKRERIEKERQEMERQREKERQRMLEIERQKELERQKVAEEKARQEEEKRMREEQLKTQKMIEKHNQSVQKSSCGLTSYSSTPALQTMSAMPSKTLQVSLTNINMAVGASASAAAASSKLPVTSSATASKPAVPSLNKTFAKEQNSDSYQMTPVAQKVRKPASSENYDIGDLHSDDSTDEEDKPRKKIPAWAAGPPLKAALINQQYHPPDLNRLFGKIDPPNLNEVFEKKKPRFNKRTSSAHWDTSIMLPTTP